MVDRARRSLSILDPLFELKEATNSPTPLSGMLQDPGILRTLMAPKKSRRGSTSSQRSGSHERERSKDSRRTRKESDATSVLTLVLAEEERQAHHLKAVLRATGDRLESEMRRADAAEERARAAEARAREASARASTAEAARHQTELDAARVREELTRYRMLAEAAEREVRRAEADIQRLDRLRHDAEQSAADARDVARKAQQAVREWQARDEGRLEGMKLEVRRHYDNGREDGFEDGRSEGYETGYAEGFEEGREEGVHAGRTEGNASGRLSGFDEGKQVGFHEGYKEGYEQGRKDEHAHALEAFDKFMDEDVDRDSFISVSLPICEVVQTTLTSAIKNEPNRTYQWVEANIKHVPPPESRQTASPTPRYVRPPSPSETREPAPLPISPWLSRQPRASTPAPFTHHATAAADAI